MSDEDDKKESTMNDIFGDDDSDSDDILTSKKPSPLKTTKTITTADATGLFGSDSEDDDVEEEEEETPKKKRKGKLAKKSTKLKKKKRSRKSTSFQDDDSDNEKPPAKKPNVDSGDEYDSGPDVERNKEDDDFIDEDDDLADVLGEYDNDAQKFADERPQGPDFGEDEEKNIKNDNFFDETLKAMKSGRRRSKLALSGPELEQLAQEILYRMDSAAQSDQQAVQEGRPGLEKLKFLNTAIDILSKVQLQSTLLDFNLLEIMKKWIQPSENGTLPNVGMRTKLLSLSRRLPIYKDHLKRSGYGKVIMALWKHPDETHENKAVCKELIEKWSRSVFDKSLDYRKLAELESERGLGYRNPSSQENKANGTESRRQNLLHGRQSAAAADPAIRVRMPEQMNLDFVHRPQPKVDREVRPSAKLKPDSKRGKLVKRMQDIARPTRRNVRAINLSVEGRGI